MTPEQRTITRTAFAQALGTTTQENARARFMTGQVNARAKYAFDLTDSKDQAENSAAYKALKAMHEKGVLSPQLDKAATAILEDAKLPAESPAFKAMFDIVAKTNFPTTTLTGNANQSAVTSKLQQDLAATQASVKDMGRVAETFDPTFLTWVGKARAGIGGLAETALGMTVDRPFRAQYAALVSSAAQGFNGYVHDVTGAQMSIQERERYLEAYPNTHGDSPTAFVAKFLTILQMKRDRAALIERQLRNGVDPESDPKAKEEQTALVRQYGYQLEALGTMSDDQLQSLMRTVASADEPPPPKPAGSGPDLSQIPLSELEKIAGQGSK